MNEKRSPQDAANTVLSQNPSAMLVLALSPGMIHCEFSKPMALSDLLLLQLHFERTIHKMMDELQRPPQPPENILPIKPVAAE